MKVAVEWAKAGFEWFSRAHSSVLLQCNIAQHTVHELVNHDNPFHFLPELHSSCSFIKKPHKLHQCTILNNRLPVLAVEKCREHLSLTWLYSPSAYEGTVERFFLKYTVKVLLCLSCLSLYSAVYPSIYDFNGLSVLLVDHQSNCHAVTHTFVGWFSAMHIKWHVYITRCLATDSNREGWNTDYFQTCMLGYTSVRILIFELQWYNTSKQVSALIVSGRLTY